MRRIGQIGLMLFLMVCAAHGQGVSLPGDNSSLATWEALNVQSGRVDAALTDTAALKTNVAARATCGALNTESSRIDVIKGDLGTANASGITNASGYAACIVLDPTNNTPFKLLFNRPTRISAFRSQSVGVTGQVDIGKQMWTNTPYANIVWIWTNVSIQEIGLETAITGDNVWTNNDALLLRSHDLSVIASTNKISLWPFMTTQ